MFDLTDHCTWRELKWYSELCKEYGVKSVYLDKSVYLHVIALKKKIAHPSQFGITVRRKKAPIYESI